MFKTIKKNPLNSTKNRTLETLILQKNFPVVESLATFENEEIE